MDNVGGGGLTERERERERWAAYLLQFSSLSSTAFFTRAWCLLLGFYRFVLVLVLISPSLFVCVLEEPAHRIFSPVVPCS